MMMMPVVVRVVVREQQSFSHYPKSILQAFEMIEIV
jgi:hypothetical protein